MAERSRLANEGTPWTRDQLILAFELYCRIPFQTTKASNPDVQKLAAFVARSPASVARKLGNFGSFDPQLKKQGISGLTHASALDRVIWDEFHRDWAGLVVKAHELRSRLSVGAADELYRPSVTGPSEGTRLVKQRLHQVFFREAVLSSYNNTCCITGLPIRECLIASHIIPWSEDESLRADPTNGLCLSATFDRLFDRGLITVTPDMKVLVSNKIMRSGNAAVLEQIVIRHEQSIMPPVRFAPDPQHLKWHNEHVFGAI